MKLTKSDVIIWQISVVIGLLIIICLCVGGCKCYEAKLPDGSEIKKCSCLMEESFSVSYDEGSFEIDDYKSEMAEVVGAAVKAAVGQ